MSLSGIALLIIGIILVIAGLGEIALTRTALIVLGVGALAVLAFERAPRGRRRRR